MTLKSPTEFEEVKSVRTMLERVLKLRVWVACAVTSLAYFCEQILRVTPSRQPPAAVWAVIFFATLALYNLDGCLDRGDFHPLENNATTSGNWMHDEDYLQAGGAPNRRVQAGVTLGSVMGLLVLVPTLSFPCALMLTVGFLLCSLYAMPLGRRKAASLRLKAVPGLKAPFVGFAVALAVVWIPLLSYDSQNTPGDLLTSRSNFTSASMVTFTLGLLCTVNTLLFDVPDTSEDQAKGVPTAAVCLGIKGNRSLCLALCVLALGTNALTPGRPLPLFLLIGALTLATILVDATTPKMTIALWVDGALAVPALWLLLGA